MLITVLTRNKILLMTLIGIFTFVLISCSKETKVEEVVRPVNTMLIKAPSSSEMKVFPGVTLATDETTLAFQIAGQIIKLPVLEGDHVKQDEIVAELDAIIFQEKLKETKANLEKDQNNFKRAATLVKDGHLSQMDYEKVKANYEISQANYNTALNDVKNSKLTAPYSGVIVKKYVKNYEYITAKQPILLLQKTAGIDIEIHVPESVIIQLKKYQVNKEKIVAVFDSVPKQSFPVQMKEYSSQADPQTQTFRIVFTMEKPKNINILPGMSVSIHTPVGGSHLTEKNYLIPSSAVFMNAANEPSVWVIDQNTMQVKSQKVTVANFSSDQIKVLNGLKPGDLIVISGANFLVEDQKVKPMK